MVKENNTEDLFEEVKTTAVTDLTMWSLSVWNWFIGGISGFCKHSVIGHSRGSLEGGPECQ